MKFRVIAILTVFIWPSVAAGQENPVLLDFDRALELVFANDFGLKARDDDLMVSRYRVREAISTYFPNLSAYSNISKTSLESDIAIPSLFGSPAQTIRLFPTERYNFGLIAKYDLYTFGRRPASRSIAGLGLEISNVQRRAYKRDLFDRMARSFSRTILARDILSIQKENIKRAQEKLRLVERRIDQGLATEYELTAAKILLSKYKQRENQAEAEFKIARTGLKSLIEWDFPYEFMPVGEISGISAALPESTVTNPEENASIKLLKLDSDIKEKQRTIRKSAFFPGIGVFAKYDWQNGYQPDIEKIRGDWSVGVSLDWLLLDGGLRKYRLKQSDFEISGAENLLAGAHSNQEFASESAVIEIEKASRNLALTRERLELVDKEIRIAQSRYELGLMSISELIDMDLDKSEAEIAVAAADFDLLMARLQLKKALDYYPEVEY